jgi:predicted RNA-binding protein associated with RNAse of E/G family
MSPSVDVVKLNIQGKETWRYTARVIASQPGAILIEALFDREYGDLHGISLNRGDRFVEAYYSDRWYNVFEIYDRDSAQLKGWYCNISLPAQIDAQEIRYVDLALDLLVYPDGRQLTLDEDEFAALDAPEDIRAGARRGLEAVKALFDAQSQFRVAGQFQGQGP